MAIPAKARLVMPRSLAARRVEWLRQFRPLLAWRLFAIFATFCLLVLDLGTEGRKGRKGLDGEGQGRPSRQKNGRRRVLKSA
jgi:hypothetical protein